MTCFPVTECAGLLGEVDEDDRYRPRFLYPDLPPGR